jgi:hypothetical protein
MNENRVLFKNKSHRLSGTANASRTHNRMASEQDEEEREREQKGGGRETPSTLWFSLLLSLSLSLDSRTLRWQRQRSP